MITEIVTRNYKDENNAKKLADIIEKKLSKFDKFFDDTAKATAKLSTFGKDKFCIELTIVDDGKQILRSEEVSDNIFEIIDIIIPKLEKQLHKYRTRLQSKFKKANKPALPLYKEEAEEAAEAKEKYGNVVKIKNFAISILTVQDAIAELELLDHNFYVFVNAENNVVSVIYKRNDGDYGLITPEY